MDKLLDLHCFEAQQNVQARTTSIYIYKTAKPSYSFKPSFDIRAFKVLSRFIFVSLSCITLMQV